MRTFAVGRDAGTPTCKMALCAVCLDACEEGGDRGSHTLPCGHVFHAGCIVSWFRRLNTTCPVCRQEEEDTTSSEEESDEDDDDEPQQPAVRRFTEASLHSFLAPTLRRAAGRRCPAPLRRRADKYKSARRALLAARRSIKEHERTAVGRFCELRRGARKLSTACVRAKRAYVSSATPLLRDMGFFNVQVVGGAR